MLMYKDRKEAGERLAALLTEYEDSNPVIIGLPRGGVPVAYPVARKLNSVLDVLLVRKLGAPSNPELAIGALTEDNQLWLNRDIVMSLGVREPEIDAIASEAMERIRRQHEAFRRGREAISLKGRVVILVDDGLATGATMLAAIRSARHQNARQVIVAVPVASTEAATRVAGEADRFICPAIEESFFAVSQWYDDFGETTNEDVAELLEAAAEVESQPIHRRAVTIRHDKLALEGELTLPHDAKAFVIFAHGSGSSRLSPRNIQVATALNEEGFATLLFDLLNVEEARDRENVFDLNLLAYRLSIATRWLREQPEWEGLPIGYFGASTGAAAAIIAADQHEPDVYAVVSRGGRADLAGESLRSLETPVLLIVGGDDSPVLELNQAAANELPHADVIIIPGATHLFEEPGALEKVAKYAAEFFRVQLEQPGQPIRRIA